VALRQEVARLRLLLAAKESAASLAEARLRDVASRAEAKEEAASAAFFEQVRGDGGLACGVGSARPQCLRARVGGARPHSACEWLARGRTARGVRRH